MLTELIYAPAVRCQVTWGSAGLQWPQLAVFSAPPYLPASSRPIWHVLKKNCESIQGVLRPGLRTSPSLPPSTVSYWQSKVIKSSPDSRSGKILLFVGEAEKSHLKGYWCREEWLFISVPHPKIYILN